MLANLDNEVVFKKAFTNKTVFTCFVKDILDIDFVVNKIETEKKFSPKEGNIDIKYDIFAESVDHRIIVEIQRVDYDYGFDRFMRYHMMAIAQLQKNSRNYQIKKQVYTIVMFSTKYKLKNLNNLPIEDEVLILSFDPVNISGKKANIFSHKLIFLNPNYRNDNIPAHYKDWLDLVYESIHNPTKYNLNTNNKGIKKAIDLIEYDFFSETELEEMKVSESRKTVLEYVENEGMEKGLKKGKEEERIIQEKKRKEDKIKTAKSLLKNSVDLKIIMISTGLTKEEIENLQNV